MSNRQSRQSDERCQRVKKSVDTRLKKRYKTNARRRLIQLVKKCSCGFPKDTIAHWTQPMPNGFWLQLSFSRAIAVTVRPFSRTSSHPRKEVL